MDSKKPFYQDFFAWSGFRWIGVIILLVDYILVSQGYLDGKGILFNALNGLGSLFLITNSLSLKPKDWAVAAFNMVWLAIATITILKLFL